MAKKQLVISEVFEYCSKTNNLIFDNKLVKEISKKHNFANPFDATKFDNSDKLPDILKEKDYFILHLGEGKHQFIKGIKLGYHKFEPINENEIFEWKYRKSILNEYDTSESNILSVIFNQRVIHDFLYEDIVANPKMYGSRRTKATLDFFIGNEYIRTTNLQMEIDLTIENHGIVTIFEGKNNFPNDFAIYQIYFPFLYYTKLKIENQLEIKEINCCYALRKTQADRTEIRLYLYTFEDYKKMDSIKLIKKAQYNLIKR